MGIPTTNSAHTYVTKNVTPPCLKVRKGNLQTLPRPIAKPIVVTTNEALFLNLGLVVYISSLAPAAL